MHPRPLAARPLALLLLVALAATGCGPGESLHAPGDAGDDAPERPGYCLAPPPPATPSGVRLEPVFGHAFPNEDDASRLTALVASPFAPGEWYAVKHKGWVIRFAEDPARPGHEVVLDLRDGRVSVANDEAGIVSLAFHPSGAHAFLAYQSPSRSGAFFDSVISRFAVRADGTLDPGSEVELVRLPQPNFPHSVDHVAFGRDGYLYATFGDGGTSASRPEAQDPSSLYGTMIRLDVDRDDPVRGTPYAIPADNPFADGVGGAPEVFAWGLRNTWRFSFDGATGDIWGGDVGESRREEINRIVAGGNYGWPIVEGDLCFGAETCDTSGLEPPVLVYDHGQGISVTGGHVYRGAELPSLTGRYVYADYLSGTVWSIDAASEAGSAVARVEVEAGFWITSFGESPDGELYLIRWSQAEHFDKTGPGGIYKLVAAEAPPVDDPFPALLSQTGCVSADAVTEPATGLRPYAPSAALWSDGAGKERFLSLPEGARIEVDDEGKLRFPEGTVLVKHFGFGERRHETRLLVHHEGGAGWRGYTYRWREDQSDAELLEGGLDETLPDGVAWRYPSRSECARCHTPAAAFVLGLELSQLAGPQLAAWHDAGLFAPEVDAALLGAFAPLSAIDDAEASVEARARSYLHSNCAGCHRPGGPPQTGLDLRAATPLAEMHLCDTLPLNGTLGVEDPDALRLLVPGAPERSILYLRLTHPGQHRMPPLGTHLVDDEAAAVVAAWIEGLAACP